MASTTLDSYQHGQGIFERKIEKHEPVFVLHYTLLRFHNFSIHLCAIGTERW